LYGRWVRPYQWHPIWRHTRVADGHTVLNHAPVRVGGSLLWLAVLGAGPSARHAWLGVGEWRIGGLYAPANAQFCSANLTLPTRPLVLNADVAWPGISDPASQCDTLQELCQGYVMVELVDTATGAVEPGYEARDCVIQNQDSDRIPLQWSGRDTAALAGRVMQLRFTLREAVIFAVGVQTAKLIP
jgi:hypothetical protein